MGLGAYTPDSHHVQRGVSRGQVKNVVVEILSSATRDRDRVLTRDLYAAQGVRWYVILDPESDRTVPLRLTADGEYASPLDASVVIEILLDRVLDPGQSLVVPHVLDLEVTQVLRRHAIGRETPSVRAAAAFNDDRDLRISRYPHAQLLARIWSLRNNCTAYDAADIALTETLDCPLLTCDADLAVVPGHRATVEVPDQSKESLHA